MESFCKSAVAFWKCDNVFLLLVALPGLLDGLAGGWGIFYALYAGLGIVCDLQFFVNSHAHLEPSGNQREHAGAEVGIRSRMCWTSITNPCEFGFLEQCGLK